jgi:hypothetical protein
MNKRIVLRRGGHEYSIERCAAIKDGLRLSIDNSPCNPNRRSFIWGNGRIIDYFISFQNSRTRLSIILWHKHLYSVRRRLILKINGEIVYGENDHEEYRIEYYKHIARRDLLMKQHPVKRLIMMQWKRALGYYGLILGILLASGMLSLVGGLIFAALTIAIFLGIGIRDNINLKKEASHAD